MVEPNLDEQEFPDQDDPKDFRCGNFKFGEDATRSYTENTSKEELVLEHVLEYNRQFKIIYDPTRELLLAPENECNMKKFICTSIRPTKMPFTELYHYEGCAKFIADYLEYEELETPNRLPGTIPSPANVLDWQAGDCFDFAIALCSMLIGCGYDAYVVYGTAPKAITTKDESLMECQFDTGFDDEMSDEDFMVDKDEEQLHTRTFKEASPMPTFNVHTRQEPKSEFDINQAKTKEAQLKAQYFKETHIDDDEPDYEPEDEYGRSRIHAWVLIQKKQRQMEKSIFIEPSTGRTYDLDQSPYHSIEAIFNHLNYWINMDPSRDIDQMNMEFQEDVSGEWEYVMIQKKKKGETDDAEEEHSEEASEEGEGDEEILDMPPPWSPKLFIDKDKFKESCPNGEKTVFYKKCKVDFFAECSQPDGITKRITLFEDYKRLITKEIRCYYTNRKDNLLVRRRFPYEFKLVEHYASSDKSYHWKKLIQVDGHYRKLYYYHHRNKDGIIYREERIGRKTFEYYTNRPDKLVYRSVTFDPEGTKSQLNLTLRDNHHPAQDSVINKMTQKFELDPTQPAATQIKRTEFNLGKDTVYIYYHYQQGRITAGHHSWSRSQLITQGKVGDNEKEEESSYEKQTQGKIIDMEVKCHESVRDHEKTAQNEMLARQDSEKTINQLRQTPNTNELFQKVLDKSVMAKARDKMKQGKQKDETETRKDQSQDFLAPILKKLSLPLTGQLEEEAAIQVKTEALKSLKERLLTRAEIIQRRLEEEQKKLESAYQRLKRKGDTFGQNDHQQYEKDVQDANFRMDILTERASQHYRNSLEKFHEMDTKLSNDPRLITLQGRK